MKDDTGSCQLMLLDTVAKTIIGEKAETLWDGSYAEVTNVYWRYLFYYFKYNFDSNFEIYRSKTQIFCLFQSKTVFENPFVLVFPLQMIM